MGQAVTTLNVHNGTPVGVTLTVHNPEEHTVFSAAIPPNGNTQVLVNRSNPGKMRGYAVCQFLDGHATKFKFPIDPSDVTRKVFIREQDVAFDDKPRGGPLRPGEAWPPPDAFPAEPQAAPRAGALPGAPPGPPPAGASAPPPGPPGAGAAPPPGPPGAGGYAAHMTRLPVQSVANPGGANPAGQGPESLMSDATGTKFLMKSKSGVLDFTFPSPCSIASYRFMTANDVPTRDPMAWRLIGPGNVILDDRSVPQGHPEQRHAWYHECRLLQPTQPVPGVRLEILNNAGDSVTQLCVVQFWGVAPPSAAPVRLQISGVQNPGGENPPNEGPINLANDEGSKWLATGAQTRLKFTLAAPAHLTGYRFMTCHDEPGRDPTRWRLSAPNGQVLDDRSAIPQLHPDKRYEWYPMCNIPHTRQLRTVILDIVGNAGLPHTQLSRVELYGTPVAVPKMRPQDIVGQTVMLQLESGGFLRPVPGKQGHSVDTNGKAGPFCNFIVRPANGHIRLESGKLRKYLTDGGLTNAMGAGGADGEWICEPRADMIALRNVHTGNHLICNKEGVCLGVKNRPTYFKVFKIDGAGQRHPVSL